MRDVWAIGIGQTRFGELWKKSLRDLIVEAGLEAIRDAGIAGKQVEALYGGCMSSGQLTQQEHLATLIADFAGIKSIPATRVECGTASGSVAFRQACLAVASGMHDMVVVGGVEKVMDVDKDIAAQVVATSTDQEWESFFGATLASLYALMARRHMHKYGTTEEQLGLVAVKNHANAVHNPRAQYKRKLSLEKILASPYVAEPLKMLDCASLCDGASAVVLSSTPTTKKPAVKVLASAQASDSIALHSRSSITSMTAVKRAANEAYKQAGKGPKEIDLAEVHDCFTIAEIINIEDLGICKPGEGGKATEDGLTAPQGEIPVNTSGGLKARGDALGATGIAQLVELVEQLRGEAAERQVKDARLGLALNVGGTGGSACVHILERV